MERSTNSFSVLEGQIFEVKVLVEKLIHSQHPVTLPDFDKYEARVNVTGEELGCKPQTVYMMNIHVITHKKNHGKLLFNRAELRKYGKNEGAKNKAKTKKENDSNLPMNGIQCTVNDLNNTINLRGDNLKKAKIICSSQRTKILAFLNNNSDARFTKHEIKKYLVRLRQIRVKTPENSISSALSKLYKDNRIIKHRETRKGDFEKPNHLWSIRKQMASVGTQTVLFE